GREALEQFLNERAAKRVAPETAASLLASGNHALMVGDSLNRFADMGYQGRGCPQGVEALRSQTHDTLEALRQLADRLDRSGLTRDPVPLASDGVLRNAALGCLRRWRKDPHAGRSAI